MRSDCEGLEGCRDCEGLQELRSHLDCEGHLGALTWDLQRLCEGTWDLQRRTWGPAPSPLERRRRLVVVAASSSSRVFFEKSEDRSEDR